MQQEIDQKILVNNKLRSVRTKKKLSQYEVAYRAKITKECYQLAEKGRTTPNLLTALLIAQALDKTVDQLFYLVREKVR